MKFKGIIPELKFSEGSNQIGYFIEMFEPYPVVSVNTSSVFNGHISFIDLVRERFPKKFIIRKDFVMIPKQVEESKEMGANAVLLMKDFLSDNQYNLLLDVCDENKIIPITEIHAEVCPKGRVVLINSRNLNNGHFHKKQAEEKCKAYKCAGYNVIYASGENSDRVVKEGIADAVLIGTAFMQGEMKNEITSL